MRGRHLTLLLPGLFGDPAGGGAGQGRDAVTTDGDELPGLRTLVSRASPARGVPGGRSPESLLFECLGFSGAGPVWPAAALTALEDGALAPEDGAPAHRGVWMRADPVHLEAGMPGLVLSDPRRLGLTRGEADALCMAINEGLGNVPGRIEPLAPERWYVACERLPRMTTCEPSIAVGDATGPVLPRGPEAGTWLRALTEIQMLLHASPANREREAQGKPAVNSVWFWGAGTLPPRPESPPDLYLWSDEVLARGLGRRLGVQCRALPADAAAWLAQSPEEGRHVLYCDDLYYAARLGDRPEWMEERRRWEAGWFEPLRRALWAGGLAGIRIEAGGGVACEVPASARWRWWRRRKPLPVHSPEPAPGSAPEGRHDAAPEHGAGNPREAARRPRGGPGGHS